VRAPRALILAPTRELAIQICDSFEAYGRFLPLSGTTVYGGVGQEQQVRDLARGVDILVATPGRLLDLMEQGHVRLHQIEVFVLDEADRMLDMGFIVPVRRIVRALPAKRQTLLFSATMPKEVASLADSMLTDPVAVEVASVSTTAPRIEESVVAVERAQKPAALGSLLQRPGVARALIFTRTKRGADKLVRQLGDYRIRADALHGNMSQNARQRTLDNFRDGRTSFLVATDIAARGIDIESITHIVNYDLPDAPEAYVHRIGRTARAGASGAAISLCSSEEYEKLREIEKLIKRKVPVVDAAGRPAPGIKPPPPATRLHAGAKSPQKSSPPSKRPAPGHRGSGNNAVVTPRRQSFGRNRSGR
jgi:ATP-dependent RNA helicase RhlE